MTVSYTSQIATRRKYVSFWRVLIRWRGSLYKLIWQELLCYCAIFLLINYINKHVLTTNMQLILQKVKSYLSVNISMFPVPFVLSFFVDQVATKWWNQFCMVPSPDMLGIFANAAVPGKDETSRMIRRTVVRYAILSLVLTLRSISTNIKKRFPTLKHVQDAGLILVDEMVHYDKLDCTLMANNWLPLVWAANVVTSTNNIQKISSEHCLRLLISELTAHRNKLGTLVGYDLVNIPLVYTQTIVVVVVSYTTVSLFSNQPDGDNNGYAFSGITIPSIYNFIIYVGLMKVAAVMLNPFGEDDDDFELNALIDRHFKAAYMIVDEMHDEEPEMLQDAFWDKIVPNDLPYTVGSVGIRKLDPNCSPEVIFKRTKQVKSKNNEHSKNNSARRGVPMEIKRNRMHFSEENNREILNDNFKINVSIEVFINAKPNSLANKSEANKLSRVTKPDNELEKPSTSKQYFV